jgi:mannosyltransferase
MPSPEAPNASASPALSEPGRAWQIFFLVTIAAVAAAVRFHSLAAKPFWFDECFSTELARIGWRSFLHLLWWREANMSFYYVLLRGWMGLVPASAQSEFFIRSLSVLFSLAALPAIHWLAGLLHSRRAGFAAAALLAFNAFDIRYAQEARSYSLVVLLATLSSGFFVAYLRKPQRRTRLAYVVVSALAVYTHFYALLLFVAHGLALQCFGLPEEIPQDTREAIRRGLRRSWISIGIAILPLLVFIAKTGAGPIRWIPRPDVFSVTTFAIYATDGLPVIYLFAALIGAVPLARNLLARNQKWRAWSWQFLMLCLLFPIVLTLALSFARPVFLPRYMIFCLPALLILVAGGLASMRPAWLSAVCVFITLALSARMIPYVYSHDFDDERDSCATAANFILDHSQPGDAIVFHIAEARIPYEFFRSARAGENTASPAFSRQLGPEILFPNHGAGLSYRDFTGKPAPDMLLAVANNHPRLWVMLMYNETASHPDATTEMIDHTVPAVFPKVQKWPFPKVEVRLYSLR